MQFKQPTAGICVSTGSYSDRIAERKYHIYGIEEDEILKTSERIYGESSLINFIALTNALYFALSNKREYVYTDCYLAIRNVNERQFVNIASTSPLHKISQDRAVKALEWINTLTFKLNNGSIEDNNGNSVFLRKWNWAYNGEIPVNKHIKDVYF